MHRYFLLTLSCLVLWNATAFAQERTISGTVSDSDDGGGLPGVNILVKNSSVGTVTDADGNFNIAVPEGGNTLVLSSVGYETQEVAINNQATINVSLASDIQALSEVVVVGYGTQTKKDISGSISSIDAESIKDLPVTGLDQALAGQAAGIQVSQSSGAPGGAVKVRVRGTVSISSDAQPLYVIDGFPISVVDNQVANPLNGLNPSDIASIEVLKDASATAIYGSRASNGVVIVTTKKGEAGTSNFNLNFYTGFQQVQRRVDVLNASEFVQLYQESRNNSYIDGFGAQGAQITDDTDARVALGATNSSLYHIAPELASDPASYGEGTNWQDAIFRNAPITNIQLGANGGTDKVRYNLSGGYFNQQGVVIESGFKRYSLNASVEANATDRLKLGFNLNASYSISDIVNAEGSWHSGGVVTTALIMPPTIPVTDEDGNYLSLNVPVYRGFGFINGYNPVQSARELERDATQLRTLGTLYGEYKITDDLSFKALVGTDYFDYTEDKFTPISLPPGLRGGDIAYQVNRNLLNYLSEFTLQYNKTFGSHSLNAVVGYTAQRESGDRTRVEGNDFPNDYVRDVTGGVITSYTTAPYEWSLLSLLGRVNYSFQDKYLLTATIRRDGSSRFGSANRWGNFPSASVGWRVSEESFMDDVNFIDELKLRTSYGLTGNNSIGNYSAIGRLGASNYVSGSSVNLGLTKQSLSNLGLGWETTKQFNIGLELGLVGNRVFVTADYYDKQTEDLLLNVPVSSISGVSNYTTNIGAVSNKGWELTLDTRNLVGDFTWRTNLNISVNRNEVTKLGVSDDPIFTGNIAGQSHIAEVGYPIGSYYGYVWDGVFLNQSELDAGPIRQAGRAPSVGDVRFADLDGDGVVNANDQQIIGDWQPDFIYGMTNNFAYKNLDLSVLIQGSEGNEAYNIQKRNLGVMVMYGNEYRASLGRWQSPENPGNGYLPKTKRALAQAQTVSSSSYYIDDASFLHIKNITLGYRFPTEFLERLTLSSLRAYVSIQNALLFTNYPNYNPEVNATNTTGAYSTNVNNLNPGVDYGSYPLARTFSFGLNVTF